MPKPKKPTGKNTGRGENQKKRTSLYSRFKKLKDGDKTTLATLSAQRSIVEGDATRKKSSANKVRAYKQDARARAGIKDKFSPVEDPNLLPDPVYQYLQSRKTRLRHLLHGTYTGEEKRNAHSMLEEVMADLSAMKQREMTEDRYHALLKKTHLE